MKVVKIDARVAIGAVALGSLGSGLLGYAIARSKARREYEIRLDEAVSEVKAHYTRPIIPGVKTVQSDSRRTKWADIVREALDEKTAQDPLEGIGDRSVDLEPSDEGADGGRKRSETEGTGGLQDLGPVSEEVLLEEPPFPFEIPEAEFGELRDEGFQTISVTYYAADKVLVDDKEQPIRDIQGTVGTLNPLGFGGISGDPHIRYVRNRRLEVDFEILLNSRSYAETVLGYGQPNRRHEKSPASTRDGRDHDK